VVNDANCANNVICGGQVADNTQGGLGQPSPNHVTLRVVTAHAQPAVLGAIMPVVH
jgi:hypothetical protein